MTGNATYRYRDTAILSVTAAEAPIVVSVEPAPPEPIVPVMAEAAAPAVVEPVVAAPAPLQAAEPPRAEPPRAETPRAETPRAETPRAEPSPAPGVVVQRVAVEDQAPAVDTALPPADPGKRRQGWWSRLVKSS